MLVVKINNLWKNLPGGTTGLPHRKLQRQAFWKGWAPNKAQSGPYEVTCALQGAGWRATTLIPDLKIGGSASLKMCPPCPNTTVVGAEGIPGEWTAGGDPCLRADLKCHLL